MTECLRIWSLIHMDKNSNDFVEKLKKLCKQYGYSLGGGGNGEEFKLHIYKTPVPPSNIAQEYKF